MGALACDFADVRAQVTQVLCECGCGAPVGKGWRGRQLRFLQGHWSRTEGNRRTRKPNGAGHGNWKGDSARYSAVHMWLRRNRQKSGVCDECGAEGFTEWANVSGEYRREDRLDWRELCRSCHRRADKLDPKRPATLRSGA